MSDTSNNETSVAKELLQTALKGFLERLEKTEKFVLDQAPDVCQQMVTEVTLKETLNLSACVFLMLCALSVFGISVYYCFHVSSDVIPLPIIIGLLGACGAFGCFIEGCCSLYKLLYVKNCPKLFLLREFRKLVK